MFDNFRRFGRICSVISVGSARFGSVTGFIHSLTFLGSWSSRPLVVYTSSLVCSRIPDIGYCNNENMKNS